MKRIVYWVWDALLEVINVLIDMYLIHRASKRSRNQRKR